MERTKSEKEAYLDGYGEGVKDEAKFRCDVFNDFEWKSRSLFFGFVESTENLEESFCDCNPNKELIGIHKGDCMVVLFRKDVQNLEKGYKKLRKEYLIKSEKPRRITKQRGNN